MTLYTEALQTVQKSGEKMKINDTLFQVPPFILISIHSAELGRLKTMFSFGGLPLFWQSNNVSFCLNLTVGLERERERTRENRREPERTLGLEIPSLINWPL